MAIIRDLNGFKIFKPLKYEKQLYEDSHRDINYDLLINYITAEILITIGPKQS